MYSEYITHCQLLGMGPFAVTALGFIDPQQPNAAHLLFGLSSAAARVACSARATQSTIQVLSGGTALHHTEYTPLRTTPFDVSKCPFRRRRDLRRLLLLAWALNGLMARVRCIFARHTGNLCGWLRRSEILSSQKQLMLYVHSVNSSARTTLRFSPTLSVYFSPVMLHTLLEDLVCLSLGLHGPAHPLSALKSNPILPTTNSFLPLATG